jgi:hypothetical protein
LTTTDRKRQRQKKRRKKCKVKELKRPSLKEQRPHWVPRQSSAQCAKSPYLSGMRSLFVGLQDAASKNGLTGTFVGYSRISLALDNLGFDINFNIVKKYISAGEMSEIVKIINEMKRS